MRALIAIACLMFASAALADAPASSARSRTAETRTAPRLAREMQAAGLRLGAPVFVRITKAPAELEVWIEGPAGAFVKFKTYQVCTFSGGLGPKTRVGDLQAPEGFYAVPAARMNPWSSYHLSFDLGYPNVFDRAQGRTGSALMVHGDCVSIGCYAMGDAAIEEIWTAMAAAFRAGQPFVRVHAFPFRMDRLSEHPDAAHAQFWSDLKRGWDAFEKTKRPPEISVSGGRYVLR